MREQWIKIGQDSMIKVGSRVIVDTQDNDLGDGFGSTSSVTPYMAEVIEFGSHWSEPGSAGYHVLTRELPDGERLAEEYYERLERECHAQGA